MSVPLKQCAFLEFNLNCLVSRSQTSSLAFDKPELCTDLDLNLLTVPNKEHIAISYGKIKCQRSVFASRSHARALGACLRRQDDVCITTDEWAYFHENEFDEMTCELESTKNPRSIEKHSTSLEQYT